MVPCYFVTLAAGIRSTIDDVHARPILPMHVEIACGEVEGTTIIEISRDRQRLQENFPHITADLRQVRFSSQSRVV